MLKCLSQGIGPTILYATFPKNKYSSNSIFEMSWIDLNAVSLFYMKALEKHTQLVKTDTCDHCKEADQAQ